MEIPLPNIGMLSTNQRDILRNVIKACQSPCVICENPKIESKISVLEVKEVLAYAYSILDRSECKFNFEQ